MIENKKSNFIMIILMIAFLSFLVIIGSLYIKSKNKIIVKKGDDMFGIICAMKQESDHIIKNVKNKKRFVFSNIVFVKGKLCDKNVVVAKSGVGKVNAAMCAQVMIDNFKIKSLINAGVAGATNPNLNVLDIVISDKVFYHDINAKAIGYKQGQIPEEEQNGGSEFFADKDLIQRTVDACNKIKGIRAIIGTIASGDVFIDGEKERFKIFKEFNAQCCEMEGASIGHVAKYNKIPFVIIRSISDVNHKKNKQIYTNSFVDKGCENIVNIIKLMISTYE